MIDNIRKLKDSIFELKLMFTLICEQKLDSEQKEFFNNIYSKIEDNINKLEVYYDE